MIQQQTLLSKMVQSGKFGPYSLISTLVNLSKQDSVANSLVNSISESLKTIHLQKK